jgi:hypothetical protein
VPHIHARGVADDTSSPVGLGTHLSAAEAAAARTHGAKIAADVSDDDYFPEKDPALQVCLCSAALQVWLARRLFGHRGNDAPCSRPLRTLPTSK